MKKQKWEKELWHDLLTGLGLEDEEADVAMNLIRPYFTKTRKEVCEKIKDIIKDEIYLGLGKPNADNILERINEIWKTK